MNDLAPNSKNHSSSSRPIMTLLDVLGQRWTLRILWELNYGRANFRTLRKKCDNISPTVLNKRLKQLRDLKLVELDDHGYALSKLGLELAHKLIPLNSWADKWAAV